MRQKVERLGRPAAPGVAAGPLFLITAAAGRRESTEDPARERRDLVAAISAAIRSIRALATGMDSEAADILEFQAAMLEDEALVAPAIERIAAGVDATTAWSHAVAVQTADYQREIGRAHV